MLYMIDYTIADDMAMHRKFVKSGEQHEAVKTFMDWFFAENPFKRVRVDLVTTIEMTGALELADEIEHALENGE